MANLEKSIRELTKEVKDLKKTNEMLVREVKASEDNGAEDLAFVLVSII